jgi:hypothetical protein
VLPGQRRAVEEGPVQGVEGGEVPLPVRDGRRVDEGADADPVVEGVLEVECVEGLELLVVAVGRAVAAEVADAGAVPVEAVGAPERRRGGQGEAADLDRDADRYRSPS